MTTSITLKSPPKGIINFKTFFLIFFIILNLIYGITYLVHGLEPNVLIPVAFIAFVVGWLLARSRIKNWQAVLISLIFGLLIIFIQISGLDTYFISEINNLKITWPRPNFIPLLLIFQEIGLRLSIIVARFVEWLIQFFSAQSVYDPVMFNILWGFGIWFSSFWASWSIRRFNNPLIALIPSLLIYTSSLDFSGGNANRILPMLGIGFAFIIFIRHEEITTTWKENQTRFPSTINENTNKTAILVSLILILVATTLPSISFSKIQDFFKRIQTLAKSQGTNTGSTGFLELGTNPEDDLSADALEDHYSAGLPNTHLIFSPPELSEQIVMLVQVDDPYASQVNPTYYFRSLSYELYTNQGWDTKVTFNQNFTAGQPAITQIPPNQRPVNQHVEMTNDSENNLIYVPGTLTDVDSDYRVGFRSEENKDESNDIFGAIVTETSFRTESYLPLFGEDDLRSAGQDYPNWVKNRYLGLPDTVPDRVLTLAYEITILKSTPYDRAVAIEQYLRTFPYTTEIPDPPLGKDIADHFLFNLQKGYCDYYATSMVVLARASGLPARFVVGYIGQTYDSDLDAYVVTADQAHSWVEIYFPEYGWVQFEPTAGRPAINRQVTNPQTLPKNLTSPEASISEPRSAIEQFIQSILPFSFPLLIILILLTLYLVPQIDIWFLHRKKPAQIALLLYHRLYSYGSRIDVTPRPKDTPLEYVARLSQRLNALAKDSSTTFSSGNIEKHITWLTQQTVKTLYSPFQPDLIDKGKMILVWKQLRWELLKTYWRMRLSQFQKPH